MRKQQGITFGLPYCCLQSAHLVNEVGETLPLLAARPEPTTTEWPSVGDRLATLVPLLSEPNENAPKPFEPPLLNDELLFITSAFVVGD